MLAVSAIENPKYYVRGREVSAVQVWNTEMCMQYSQQYIRLLIQNRNETYCESDVFSVEP